MFPSDSNHKETTSKDWHPKASWCICTNPELLPNGQAALPNRCLRTSLWGGAWVLGSWFKSGGHCEIFELYVALAMWFVCGVDIVCWWQIYDLTNFVLIRLSHVAGWHTLKWEIIFFFSFLSNYKSLHRRALIPLVFAMFVRLISCYKITIVASRHPRDPCSSW